MESKSVRYHDAIETMMLHLQFCNNGCDGAGKLCRQGKHCSEEIIAAKTEVDMEPYVERCARHGDSKCTTCDEY